MKQLLLAALLVVPVLAQTEAGFGEQTLVGDGGHDYKTYGEYPNNDILLWATFVDLTLGKAYLSFTLQRCKPTSVGFCPNVNTIANPKIISDIKRISDDFNKKYADFDKRIDFNDTLSAAGPAASPLMRFATVANPQLILLSGFGDNNVSLFDLKTYAQSNTVILPDGMSRTFGLRPTRTGLSREVWTHHFSTTGGQMVISDLAVGRIAGTIPIATAQNFTAVDIVFSNNGKTAYVVSTEQTADADGNFAALRIFDADARTLKSTARLPMAVVDSAMMAPDGLTIYLIGKGSLFREQIGYYDVLSGTADLRTFAQEPLLNAAGAPTGLFNNLFPLGKPQMHPDGNRLFILHNFQVRAGSTATAYAVSVFDLSQRKVVSKFPVSFASDGKGLKMELDQTGGRLTILSDKGQVQLMDPISGTVTGSYQAAATTVDIFTTPLIP